MKAVNLPKLTQFEKMGRINKLPELEMLMLMELLRTQAKKLLYGIKMVTFMEKVRTISLVFFTLAYNQKLEVILMLWILLKVLSL